MYQNFNFWTAHTHMNKATSMFKWFNPNVSFMPNKRRTNNSCEMSTRTTEEGTFLHICSFPGKDVMTYVNIHVEVVERTNDTTLHSRTVTVEDNCKTFAVFTSLSKTEWMCRLVQFVCKPLSSVLMASICSSKHKSILYFPTLCCGASSAWVTLSCLRLPHYVLMFLLCSCENLAFSQVDHSEKEMESECFKLSLILERENVLLFRVRVTH